MVLGILWQSKEFFMQKDKETEIKGAVYEKVRPNILDPQRMQGYASTSACARLHDCGQ